MRQRLILATLSGKTVKIKNIRSKDDNPGLKDFEASVVRLLDKLTNGSNIIVSETGTSLLYHPGLLIGGKIEHDCDLQRSIGYFLEVIMCLAPFTKKPVHAVLRGITNDQVDPSVDMIKLSTLPVLKRFLGTDEGLELKVTRRGAAPEGGGEVMFSCPCRQKLRPLNFTEPGKVKRIRGVAWVTRMSPATANRVVDAARSVLNSFLPDIYIYTDHMKGAQSGKLDTQGLLLCGLTARMSPRKVLKPTLNPRQTKKMIVHRDSKQTEVTTLQMSHPHTPIPQISWIWVDACSGDYRRCVLCS